MWLRNPLDDILSSRAKVSLLRVLMRSPSPLNGREVARRAGIDPGHASRQLRDLALSGVLRSRDHGRVVTYEIGEDASGIVACLRNLFEAEEVRYRGSVQGFAERLPGILSIVLFGSEARLEARPGSDTDLLFVVSEHSEALDEQVQEVCLELASKHSLALSWLVVGVSELQEMEEAGNEFWTNVLREGIRLHGKSLEALQRSWRRGETT